MNKINPVGVAGRPRATVTNLQKIFAAPKNKNHLLFITIPIKKCLPHLPMSRFVVTFNTIIISRSYYKSLKLNKSASRVYVRVGHDVP